MAAKFTIAEVEEVVEAGQLKPEASTCPVYVDAVVCLPGVEKKIERVTTAAPGSEGPAAPASGAARRRERIVRRAALELKHGMNVNLGIGMPTLASARPPPGCVMRSRRTDCWGWGLPPAGRECADLINAGKETVTTPGSSIFSSGRASL